MRSIKFDQVGNNPAPRLRPTPRAMLAVKPPEQIAEGSLTLIPVQAGQAPGPEPAGKSPPQK